MENRIDFTEDINLDNVSFANKNDITNNVSLNISTNSSNKTFFGNKSNALHKVFVGGLKYSTSEESFKNYFQKFGTLTDYVIIKDSLTKRSRGFGFITYSSLSMVDELMKNRPHFIDERKLDLKRITPRNVIICFNLLSSVHVIQS